MSHFSHSFSNFLSFHPFHPSLLFFALFFHNFPALSLHPLPLFRCFQRFLAKAMRLHVTPLSAMCPTRHRRTRHVVKEDFCWLLREKPKSKKVFNFHVIRPLRTVSTALASFPCPVSARNFERAPQARSCKWIWVIRCATCAPLFFFFCLFSLTTAELASAGIECRAPASNPPRDPLVYLRP